MVYFGRTNTVHFAGKFTPIVGRTREKLHSERDCFMVFMNCFHFSMRIAADKA